MHLNVTIADGTTSINLVFDLFDNPGVRAWAEHCQKLPKKRQIQVQPVPGAALQPDQTLTNAWTFQQQIQTALADSRYPIPLPVTQASEITQHHLNVWHRWFTDNSKAIDQLNDYDSWKHEYHWLHELNQLVHIWERYTWEWPKNQFDENYSIEVNLWPETTEHGFPLIPSVNLEPFAQYHSFERADLILDQAIHGKSTMQSFTDNDDPKHWDTTGHHLSHGGCKIITTSRRSDIYKSPEFRTWMANNNVDYKDLLGDFPLGNLRNPEDREIIARMARPEFLKFNQTMIDFEVVM